MPGHANGHRIGFRPGQSDKEFFSSIFREIERRRSVCKGRRSGSTQERARRSVSSQWGMSQQHNSTNVNTHWFRCQQPMLDHTFRTCC